MAFLLERPGEVVTREELRRGYRFIAPVEVVGATTVPAAEGARPALQTGRGFCVPGWGWSWRARRNLHAPIPVPHDDTLSALTALGAALRRLVFLAVVIPQARKHPSALPFQLTAW